MIDRVTFFCTVTGLVLSALILVAMIWESEIVMTGLKMISTIWVLLATLIIFRAVNASFGE